MALEFGQAKGSAKKSTVDSYQFVMDDNSVRMFGGLLARYVYWIEGFNGKNIPVECLSFNREAEAFTNEEKDWVKEYYPDLKCTWSYAIMCLDPNDKKAKVLNLKKKLMEQVLTAAEDLGDPTDPETGYYIHFKKVKTGPMNYNIEYRLQPLKCKPAPLTDWEKEAIANSQTIDEIITRQTPEQQKELLDKIRNNANSGADEVDKEIEDEFDLK